MLLAALSLGCGKMESGHKAPEKAVVKSGGDTSGGLPENFPKDVPIFKGATPNVAISSGERMMVHLNAAATISEVTKFYNAEFKAQGWTVENGRSEAGDPVVSARKG